MGTTVPGGRYLTSDGRIVNANGVELAPFAPSITSSEPVTRPETESEPASRSRAKPRSRAARRT